MKTLTPRVTKYVNIWGDTYSYEVVKLESNDFRVHEYRNGVHNDSFEYSSKGLAIDRMMNILMVGDTKVVILKENEFMVNFLSKGVEYRYDKILKNIK